MTIRQYYAPERRGKLRCLWSDPVKHTAADCVRPITDTDSVLCTFEDYAVLRIL